MHMSRPKWPPSLSLTSGEERRDLKNSVEPSKEEKTGSHCGEKRRKRDVAMKKVTRKGEVTTSKMLLSISA